MDGDGWLDLSFGVIIVQVRRIRICIPYWYACRGMQTVVSWVTWNGPAYK
jgi:hypothetical protein